MCQSQARALKIRDVEAITKLTASTVHRLERKGKSPKRRAPGSSVLAGRRGVGLLGIPANGERVGR
jgi:predicted DNA-binding transcriptional regulator AlpA